MRTYHWIFTALGLTVTPSVTNFLLIHFPDDDGKRAEDAELIGQP